MFRCNEPGPNKPRQAGTIQAAGSTGGSNRHRWKGKRKGDCPASCRRVGKGHNAASSLVRKKPREAEGPATTRARRVWAAGYSSKSTCSSRLHNRVGPRSGSQMAGVRANGFQQKKPPRPNLGTPLDRCQFTDRHSLWTSGLDFAAAFLVCPIVFSSLHLLFYQAKLLRVRLALHSLFHVVFLHLVIPLRRSCHGGEERIRL